jgi:hypothetical protein
MEEDVPSHEIFLGFTRHNPAVVSSGREGLNASIKGVGYIPKGKSTKREACIIV